MLQISHFSQRNQIWCYRYYLRLKSGHCVSLTAVTYRHLLFILTANWFLTWSLGSGSKIRHTQITHITQNNTPHSNKTQHKNYTNNKGHTTHNEYNANTITTLPFLFFFDSCCSHLKHTAFVKRFVTHQFLNLRQSVGLLGRGISTPQDRYLTQTQNKHRQPWVGFEPTIPVFQRAQTFHALDRAAILIGFFISSSFLI
jgi:hypothetical protein